MWLLLAAHLLSSWRCGLMGSRGRGMRCGCVRVRCFGFFVLTAFPKLIEPCVSVFTVKPLWWL